MILPVLLTLGALTLIVLAALAPLLEPGYKPRHRGATR